MIAASLNCAQVDQSATLKRLHDIVVRSEYAVVVKTGMFVCFYNKHHNYCIQ